MTGLKDIYKAGGIAGAGVYGTATITKCIKFNPVINM